ncbi:MAG: beta-ketoacyl synthase chain length factor [Undibacterium sp.]|nr:beta-ketoacyl synthase chain length factor [Undibacterium sp.]
MGAHGVSFSIARQAAWAPGIETPEAWQVWAQSPFVIAGDAEPSVRQMPSMLRRRAGFLGKLALEVAYQCLDGRTGVPAVFCSRHGEAWRSVDLLTDLVNDTALSPTGFGLAVHNASAGLFSIARADRANHLAVSAGASTVEHAVIEACSLLRDGAPEVLLVSYDICLPSVFQQFEECQEQPHAWAWLVVPADNNSMHLNWTAAQTETSEMPQATNSMPGSLEVLQFQLRGDSQLQRSADRRLWSWTRNE